MRKESTTYTYARLSAARALCTKPVSGSGSLAIPHRRESESAGGSGVGILLLEHLLLLAPVHVSAQTTSTEILGNVTAAGGAAVPGVTVTILRVATGEKRESTTNDSGDYSFPLIEIG